MYIISAIVLGLMGSFHCVGMCGPIALALPLNNTNWFTRIFGSLLYNVGRAITYALMGAVFGIVGEGLQLGGFQRWISIIMGSVMVLAVVFPALFRSNANQLKMNGGIWNNSMPYFIFSIFIASTIFFVWKYIPETKGKTLEEMEDLFNKKK